MTSLFSIALDNDEEWLAGTGSRGRHSDGQLDWTGSSDLASISRCPPSATQEDGNSMELPYHTHYPFDHHDVRSLDLPLNDLVDDPRSSYTDVATNATTAFHDVGDSYSGPPGGYQDYTEGGGVLASGPLRFGQTFDGRGPSPTGCPCLEDALPPSPLDPQPPLLHQGIDPDHPSISTRPFSSPGFYSGEPGGREAFPPMMEIRGSTWHSGTAATPLGTTAMFSPSSSQALGLHSHTHSTLNDYSPFDLYSTHNEAAPSLGHQFPGAPKPQEVLVHLSKLFLWFHTEARFKQTYEGQTFTLEPLPPL
ncbi:hypothetical protein H4582DRAFT_2069121 [Lactarius indigo]|nr:hypothetical protein H4582DRAFT_2069121 [Lactarius indigo]